MSNTSQTVDLTHHLPAMMFSLSAKISRHAHRLNAQALGLDMCEWRVIQIIGRDGSSSINNIADRIAMDRGGTSRAISRLEKRGLLTRKDDPDDRRRSTVALTKEGLNQHEPIAQFANQREVRLKACLSETEQDALEAILLKLNNQIDHMLETDADAGKVAELVKL